MKTKSNLPPGLPGRLIAVEGLDGSGKSTQIARLAAHFQSLKREVVTTREPGGTEIGEQIRNIIVHNSRGDEMCAETELLLFTAARAMGQGGADDGFVIRVWQALTGIDLPGDEKKG